MEMVDHALSALRTCSCGRTWLVSVALPRMSCLAGRSLMSEWHGVVCRSMQVPPFLTLAIRAVSTRTFA